MYYLIYVWGDVDPDVFGPFDTEEGRDTKAREIMAEDGPDCGAIFPLTITDGKPEVWPYSGKFFQEQG